ncbi:MAG: VTC domain-containing protein [Planctomycetota bacterium]|nr:VTC domain-containing protein [Planctomycetota bacterium]
MLFFLKLYEPMAQLDFCSWRGDLPVFGGLVSAEVGSFVLQGRSDNGRISGEETYSRSPNYIRRSETKYELSRAELSVIEGEFSCRLPVFEFNPGHPFTHITTVYFDTPALELYERAARCYDDNLKIRVKEYYYLDPEGRELVDPYCFIELKQRRDGMVSKQRLRVAKEYLSDFIRGEDLRDRLRLQSAPGARDEGEVQDDFDRAYEALRERLAVTPVKPVSAINYRRRVYQKDEKDLRVTFDDQVTVYEPPVNLYCEEAALVASRLGRPVGRTAKMIAEIKCRNLSAGSFPRWLEVILCTLDARSLSKFTTSVNFILNKDQESPRVPGQDGVATRVDGPMEN